MDHVVTLIQLKLCMVLLETNPVCGGSMKTEDEIYDQVSMYRCFFLYCAGSFCLPSYVSEENVTLGQHVPA